MSPKDLMLRHVALPGDHGSWVFLFSPLLIGLAAGGRGSVVSVYLVVATLAGFLIRQPLTIAVKIYSGRRARHDLAAAVFWAGLYAAIGMLHVTGLALRGFGYVLYLALPGVPVFAWYLYLVARRSERRQLLMELAATAVLSLSAPAAFWIGVGRPDPAGWILWGLVWIQTTASIVYIYLRLEQRLLATRPDLGARLRMALPALLFTTGNLLLVMLMGRRGLVPALLPLAYLPQWLESIRGTLRPALSAKPKTIGLEQLAVSVAFTILFVLIWSR